MSMTPTTEEAKTKGQSLDLRNLHAANIARQAEWCPDQVPDLSFRGNELGGECGEAQNVIKKLERERQGWRGSRATKDDLADELADVVICADLCAVTADIDLGAAVLRKFNATSEKQGLSVFLPSAPALAAPRADSALGTLAVPDGWMLVPEEATGAMWSAGQEADTHPGNSYSAVWRAMVEAATAPPVLCSPASPPSVPDSAERTAGEIAYEEFCRGAAGYTFTRWKDRAPDYQAAWERIAAAVRVTPAPSSPGVPDGLRALSEAVGLLERAREMLLLNSRNMPTLTTEAIDAFLSAHPAGQSAPPEPDPTLLYWVESNTERLCKLYPDAADSIAEFRDELLGLMDGSSDGQSAGQGAEPRPISRDEARSHLPEGLRDASLTGAIRSLALAASSENENKWRWGCALQIGLAFADKAAGEEWEHDGMASVDACYAMAAILECECGGSVWNEMVKAGAARFAEHTALARAAMAEEPKPWPRIPQPFSERGFDSLWIAEWRARNGGSLGDGKKAHNEALRSARAATAGEGRSDG